MTFKNILKKKQSIPSGFSLTNRYIYIYIKYPPYKYQSYKCINECVVLKQPYVGELFKSNRPFHCSAAFLENTACDRTFWDHAGYSGMSSRRTWGAECNGFTSKLTRVDVSRSPSCVPFPTGYHAVLHVYFSRPAWQVTPFGIQSQKRFSHVDLGWHLGAKVCWQHVSYLSEARSPCPACFV